MMQAFLNAVIVGVALTFVTQVAMMVTKCDPIKLLVICLFLGGILAPLGLAFGNPSIWNIIQDFGAGGIAIAVIGAGNACYMAAFVAVKQTVFMAAVVAVLFFLVVTAACIFGEIKHRMGQK